MRALYPPLQPSLLPLPRNPLRSYAAQTCSWACYEYECAINISQTRRRPSDACRFHPTRLRRWEWDAGRTSSCLSAAPSQTRAPRSRKHINVNIALIPPNASNCVPARYLKCDVAVRSVCQEGSMWREAVCWCCRRRDLIYFLIWGKSSFALRLPPDTWRSHAWTVKNVALSHGFLGRWPSCTVLTSARPL